MPCKTCCTSDAPLRRSRVSLPHPDVVFNEKVITDIFKVDGMNVLSLVDKGTRYVSCIVLEQLTAAAVWDGVFVVGL